VKKTGEFLWKKIEVGLAILIFWYMTEPFATTIGVQLDRGLVALQYLFTIIIIILYWKRMLYFLVQDKVLLMLLVVACLSPVWSVEPDVSSNYFNRVILRSTVLSLYLASRYSLKDLMRLVAVMLGFSLITNIAAAIALPSGRMDSAWRGVMGHKNSLGRLMAWTSAHFAILMVYLRKKRIWFSLGFCLALATLIASQAKSSYTICAGALALLPLYRTFLQRYRTKALFISTSLIFSIASISWVSTNIEFIIVDVLGKSLTLNGRQAVWEHLFSRIAERPWLGYGLDAFWKNSDEIWLAQNSLHWFSGHAHSGFIDITLQLGLVGLSLFVLSFILILIRVIYLLEVTKRIEYFLMLSFLVVMFSSQFSVGLSILNRNIFWCFYVTVAATTAVEMKRLDASKKMENFQISAPEKQSVGVAYCKIDEISPNSCIS
jgi:exopolysaccharide production protein ExoQ